MTKLPRILCALFWAYCTASSSGQTSAPGLTRPGLTAKPAVPLTAPLVFEAETAIAGQPAKFVARSGAATMFFEPRGVVMDVNGLGRKIEGRRRDTIIRMDFQGGNPHSVI